MVVHSTCLGIFALEEGYTPQNDAQAAFLIPKGEDDERYLKFDYIAFLKNVWPRFLKAETYAFKLVNEPAIVNS